MSLLLYRNHPLHLHNAGVKAMQNKKRATVGSASISGPNQSLSPVQISHGLFLDSDERIQQSRGASICLTPFCKRRRLPAGWASVHDYTYNRPRSRAIAPSASLISLQHSLKGLLALRITTSPLEHFTCINKTIRL